MVVFGDGVKEAIGTAKGVAISSVETRVNVNPTIGVALLTFSVVCSRTFLKFCAPGTKTLYFS